MSSKSGSSKKYSTKKNDTVEMNKALQEWLSEEDQRQIKEKIKTHMKDKKPQGMCQICGSNQAKAVCIKCGRSVCKSCYLHLIGLCENCLSKETAEEWKHRKPDWEHVLGVDWVD
jgi:hypothetical protein